MSKKQDLIDRWPRNGRGQVMFKNSHEAVLYAQIISHNLDAVHKIVTDRVAVRVQLKEGRQRTDVNYNVLMHLACRSAFYRECLEEVERITDEKFNPEEK
ncbi:hypothetical protein ES702_06305 [subsurface metagenome]